MKRVIVPHFREKKITLVGLTASDIQDFYLQELKRGSATSVIRYHANIHKALKYAVKIDLLNVNPADKIERPQKNQFVGSFYDADEISALLQASKGTRLELPVLFSAFYGLRRSEVIGLKWSAVDFEQNTLTIRHTVASCAIDGNHKRVGYRRITLELRNRGHGINHKTVQRLMRELGLFCRVIVRAQWFQQVGQCTLAAHFIAQVDFGNG